MRHLPPQWRAALLGLFVAGVLLVGAYVAKDLLTSGASTPPESRLSARERVMLRLLNVEREKAQLPPLVVDPLLTRLAREHSNDMIRRNYFSHLGFERRVRGVHKALRAENIEWGNGYYGKAAYQVAGWMRSTGHRDIILTRALTRIGIAMVTASGTYQGVRGATVSTNDFSSAR